jgi:hypothetical protein
MWHLLISKRLSHTNLPNRALQWMYHTRLKKQRVAKYPTGREGLETRHHNNP